METKVIFENCAGCVNLNKNKNICRNCYNGRAKELEAEYLKREVEGNIKKLKEMR